MLGVRNLTLINIGVREEQHKQNSNILGLKIFTKKESCNFLRFVTVVHSINIVPRIGLRNE